MIRIHSTSKKILLSRVSLLAVKGYLCSSFLFSHHMRVLPSSVVVVVDDDASSSFSLESTVLAFSSA
jgi:hypothetical protein